MFRPRPFRRRRRRTLPFVKEPFSFCNREFLFPEGDPEGVFSSEIIDHAGQGAVAFGQRFGSVVATPQGPDEESVSVGIDDFAFGGDETPGFGIGIAPCGSGFDEAYPFEPHAGVDVTFRHLPEAQDPYPGLRFCCTDRAEIATDLLFGNFTGFSVVAGFRSDLDFATVIAER